MKIEKSNELGVLHIGLSNLKGESVIIVGEFKFDSVSSSIMVSPIKVNGELVGYVKIGDMEFKYDPHALDGIPILSWEDYEQMADSHWVRIK